MRVLHVTFSFLPEPPAGTELYVAALARELRALGVESVIAAPGPANTSYDVDGLRVRRFAVSPNAHDLTSLYGGSDMHAASMFERILDEVRPAILHQHALTHACSVELTRIAKRRGLPVVFTYHTPTTTCQRGTLIEWGKAQCDGRLDVTRCTACTLDGLGTGAWLSRALALAPTRGGELLERMGRHGGAWTALRMSSLVRHRHAAIALFFEDIDRFVVLAPWVGDVLRRNGVPESKMVSSPHGVESAHARRSASQRNRGDRVRLVHLGRTDPVKGTDLLIRAFRATPEMAVDLDIYGIVQGDRGLVMERLRQLAAGDTRIRFLPPVPHDKVGTLLAGYDLVVVPSQWMETGPLVVLEAFAAGVPVMGSALGGIADKVTDEVDGLLVRPFDSVTAWSDALRRCAEQPEFVAKLADAVRAPRTLRAAAEEMHTVYASLLAPTGVDPRLSLSTS